MLDKAKENGSPAGSVLVVGGGIAGMQSAIDLANSGYYVYLLEKDLGHRRHDGPAGQDVPPPMTAPCESFLPNWSRSAGT